MRVGIVTCLNIPEPDFDEALLREALRARGHTPVLIAWDDERAPTDVDLYALRSTWNYYRAPERFMAWCEEAAARAPLVNPPHVVRGNLDKRYLLDLEARGLPIVPTRRFEAGARVDLAALRGETGWGDVVIKPAVSAGSWMTKRFGAGDGGAAQGFLDEILRERAALVQRCMPGFASPGERSLIWIGGELTHAILKQPRYAGEEERVSAHREITVREREVAAAALAPLRDITYARVDLAPDERDGGGVVISEVELIEPSLFFAHSAEALERYVDGLEAAVSSAPRV